MRISPFLALAVASFGLAACSINTAPRTPDVVTVQPTTPAPAVVTTQPAPSTVYVR
jgi:hypothetical protein